MMTPVAQGAVLADFAFAVQPSRLWWAWLVACALLAVVCWPSGLARLACLPVLCCVAALWRQSARICGLAVRGGEHLLVRQGTEWLAVAPAAHSVALPGLIVLHYTLAGQRQWCVLLADSAAPTALRRLRVFLRWRTLAPTSSGWWKHA